MKKKAQGLPLNVIIIAAIVLIVLVVLWAIFTGRMGVFSKGIADVTKGGSCEEAGGQVKPATEGCAEGCEQIYGNFKLTAGDVCCRPTKSCTGTATTGSPCSSYTQEASCTNAGCDWGVSTTNC